MKQQQNKKSYVTLHNFFICKDNKRESHSTNNVIDMKLSKNSFSQFFFKFTLFILIFSKSFAQNPVATPTGPTAIPTNVPINIPTGTPANNGNGNQATPNMPLPAKNRVLPNNDPNAARNVQGAPNDQRAINKEDSLRIIREEEANQDAAKVTLRRRIFGYNLFNTVKFDPTPAINIATPSNYVLGPNDQLLIDIYGYSQTMFKPIITADGYINLEKVGLIYVAGSTIEQAKDKIKSRLSKIYIGLNPFSGFPANTFLNVSLGNIRSIKVTVTGEVIAPGTYTLSSLSTVQNALYACGGPNEVGTYRKINVIRNNRIVTTFDIYELLMTGFAKNNIILQDQDIIQVLPYTSRVAVKGNTKREGLFELLEDEKLNKVIEYAGGFSPYAYRHRLKVYRNTTRERKLLDVMENEFNTFRMQSGDSVVIERVLERFENMVAVNGAIFRPGEYSLESSPTLTQLIKSAEGLKGEALTGRISIVRTREDMIVENISVNYDEIIKGKSADVALKREDVITIPSIFDLTEPAYVRIQGAINNPVGEDGIEIPFLRNMTIEDVLVKVGGLSESASLARVEVVRRKRNVDPTATNAQISDTYTFSVNSDLKVDQSGTKFVLYPFDEIFVRRSPNYVEQTFVEIQGEVIFPATYGIKSKTEKISDLIERAGGLSPQAYLEGATLVRQIQLSEIEITQRRKAINEITNSVRGNQAVEVEDVNATTVSSIGINLTKIMQNPGSNEDMILQDGDIIRIPKRLETVRVQGEVLYPTTVKYLDDKSFINYISNAGGFTKKSLKSKSYILYANGSVDRTRRFLFVNIYPKVAPGSEIIIPQKTTTAQQQIAQVQGLFATVAGTITTLIGIFTLLQISK
ncbi:MAG: SLBB domain-containing protein [Emticicia sp.]|uniref:polysaccharide biosynthesis/export family protein n=1 Tax=Emticicia sp. TaxID=1930953 RepID=UPI003BA62D2E